MGFVWALPLHAHHDLFLDFDLGAERPYARPEEINFRISLPCGDDYRRFYDHSVETLSFRENCSVDLIGGALDLSVHTSPGSNSDNSRKFQKIYVDIQPCSGVDFEFPILAGVINSL